jgi:hypothetical protein
MYRGYPPQLIAAPRTSESGASCRSAIRKTRPSNSEDTPAVIAYRAAVADLAATLRGSNVEAARAALRGFIGPVPVSKKNRESNTAGSALIPRSWCGKVTRTLLNRLVARAQFGRIYPSPMEHDRRVDTVVAGGRYELYSNYPLQIQAVTASVATA